MSVLRRAASFARVGVAMAKSAIKKRLAPEDPAAASRPLPRGEERDYSSTRQNAHNRPYGATCHSPSSPSCAWWGGDGTRRPEHRPRVAMSTDCLDGIC